MILQLILLALALAFTPTLIDLLAPGFRADPEKFALTVTLTRITFPYLLLMTLVTLQSGALNAHGLFAAAAFTSVVMNVVMIAFLGLAHFFSQRRRGGELGPHRLGRPAARSDLIRRLARRHSGALRLAGDDPER